MLFSQDNPEFPTVFEDIFLSAFQTWGELERILEGKENTHVWVMTPILLAYV